MADSHLAKEKDPDESSTDAPFRLKHFLSSRGLAEFGNEINFELPGDILKEGRQLQKSFSDESDETLMDRWKKILAFLTANANEFSAVTAVLVERHQAKMDRSGGGEKVSYLLKLADLIKLYCETANDVGNGDILVSKGELFIQIGSNQPQVRRKIPSKNRSNQTKLNIKDSRKKADKQPRKKETGKTPVVVGNNKRSANPTAKKTGRKGVLSVTNSADLTIGSGEAKRRRKDPSLTAAAHHTIATVQQANLPTNTTPLQDYSTEKQQQSGGSVGKAQAPNDADNGELSMQILSDRFDKTSPSELLSKVIKLTGSQIENVEVQLSGQRLIGRYSHEQLEELEESLRQNIIGVLLKGAKRHRHDPLVVEQFCGLLSDIDAAACDLGEMDWSVEFIGFLLEIACDSDNVSLKARESAYYEVSAMSGTGGGIDDQIRSSISGKKPYVTEICQSIRYQLDKHEYDDSLEHNWRLLSFLCEFSEENQVRFLTNGGIGLIQCYEKFNDNVYLVDEIRDLLYLLSYDDSLRQEIMTDGNLVTLWRIWNDKESLFSCECAAIFAAFLSDSPANWPLGLPTIDQIKKKLRKEVRMEPLLRSQIGSSVMV